MNNVIIDVLCLAGIACIVVAGFLVYTPLGLVILGVPLIAVSLQLRKAKTK